MKTILIILTVIQVVGVLSSTYLSRSLVVGIEDMQAGIILVAIFWIIWGIAKYVKKQKLGSKVTVNNKK